MHHLNSPDNSRAVRCVAELFQTSSRLRKTSKLLHYTFDDVK